MRERTRVQTGQRGHTALHVADRCSSGPYLLHAGVGTYVHACMCEHRHIYPLFKQVHIASSFVCIMHLQAFITGGAWEALVSP